MEIREEFKFLYNCKVEGIPKIIAQFEYVKSQQENKPYEPLDHRNPNFDKDVAAFKKSMFDLEHQLQAFINHVFDVASNTESALTSLEEFQYIMERENMRAGNEDKYSLIFHSFADELEVVKDLYEKHKDAPPAIRDMPPVAANIAWARQLLRRIETPMTKLTKMRGFEAILSTPEAKPVIRMYNKVASALIEFETLWHEGWKQAVNASKVGLHATLLIRDEQSRKMYVNFDRELIQLMRDTRALQRMGLEVPIEATSVDVHAERDQALRSSAFWALEASPPKAACAKLLLSALGAQAPKPALVQARSLLPLYREVLWSGSPLRGGRRVLVLARARRRAAIRAARSAK